MKLAAKPCLLAALGLLIAPPVLVQSAEPATAAIGATANPRVFSGVWRAGMLGGGGPRAGAAQREGGPTREGAAGSTGAGREGGPPGGAAPGGRAGGAGNGGGRVAPVIKPEYLATIPQGTLAPNQAVLQNGDPAMLCVPDGYFGSGGGYPNLIIQTANQVTIINEENHRIRRIYLTDQLPAQITPSYAGHSIGHWEGDTLIVRTTALRERDGVKNPPGYYIIERIAKSADGQQLSYATEFHSDAYATPGSNRSSWTLRGELRLQEQICEEASDNFGQDYYQ